MLWMQEKKTKHKNLIKYLYGYLYKILIFLSQNQHKL